MTHISIPIETAEFAAEVLEQKVEWRRANRKGGGVPTTYQMELRGHLEALRSAIAASRCTGERIADLEKQT